MKASYQVVSPKDSRQLSEFLAREGQFVKGGAKPWRGAGGAIS